MKRGMNKRKSAMERTQDASAEALAVLEKERIAAASVYTHPTELKGFAKHPDKQVRKGVAENLNTPSDIVIELSKDGDSDVRKAAKNRLKALGIRGVR